MSDEKPRPCDPNSFEHCYPVHTCTSPRAGEAPRETEIQGQMDRGATIPHGDVRYLLARVASLEVENAQLRELVEVGGDCSKALRGAREALRRIADSHCGPCPEGRCDAATWAADALAKSESP